MSFSFGKRDREDVANGTGASTSQPAQNNLFCTSPLFSPRAILIKQLRLLKHKRSQQTCLVVSDQHQLLLLPLQLRPVYSVKLSPPNKLKLKLNPLDHLYSVNNHNSKAQEGCLVSLPNRMHSHSSRPRGYLARRRINNLRLLEGVCLDLQLNNLVLAQGCLDLIHNNHNSREEDCLGRQTKQHSRLEEECLVRRIIISNRGGRCSVTTNSNSNSNLVYSVVPTTIRRDHLHLANSSNPSNSKAVYGNLQLEVGTRN
jgi:hypothetical protein